MLPRSRNTPTSSAPSSNGAAAAPWDVDEVDGWQRRSRFASTYDPGVHVIDDVASYQLRADIQQPRCRPVRSSVRRGTKLRLRCNVSGRASVRFRGDRSRTLRTRLSSANGNGTVSTRGLRPGRYRVTVRADDLQLGRSFTVRVR